MVYNFMLDGQEGFLAVTDIQWTIQWVDVKTTALWTTDWTHGLTETASYQEKGTA